MRRKSGDPAGPTCRHPADRTVCPESGGAGSESRCPGVVLDRPLSGLAGRPPEQLLDTPALTLGWTARTAVPDSHRDSLLARRKGRAVVDVAPGGSRRADTLGDDLLDDHDAFTSLAAQ